MPVDSKPLADDDQKKQEELSLISEGLPLITAKITLQCPNCHRTRRFRNTFTGDKIDLILVSIKIIDWLSCDDCGFLYNTGIEFEI